jgi:hypothetical protein
MSKSSDFCRELAHAAHALFWLPPGQNRRFSINNHGQLWNALGTNAFSVRTFETDGIVHRDHYPLPQVGPLDITLTVDVWGSTPCVHLAARFDNGAGTVGFSSTLDYVKLPSDLKVDRLFHYWLKGFSLAVGMEGLFNDIDSRVINTSVPVGVDAIVLSARRVGDADEQYDIEQIDVTISCIAPKAQLAVCLPFLPIMNWDISYLTTTSGPLSDEAGTRTYLNATVEFGGAEFDVTSEFPYRHIEAAIGETMAAASAQSGRRVACGPDPTVSIAAFAQRMTQPGQRIFQHMQGTLTGVAMLFDSVNGQVAIQGSAMPWTCLNDRLAVGEMSVYIDCTFVSGNSCDGIATLVNVTVDGIFATPINPEGSWFEAAFDLGSGSPVASLRLARESDPQVAGAEDLAQLLAKLPEFLQSPTSVYLDQPNYINKPEQRGGDYHPWHDKFQPAADGSSGSGDRPQQPMDEEPTSPGGPNADPDGSGQKPAMDGNIPSSAGGGDNDVDMDGQ